jgi:hypothetical protein
MRRLEDFLETLPVIHSFADKCRFEKVRGAPMKAPSHLLQIGLAGRDRFLIPFEANPRNIGNVKQSVTNFIGFL